MYTRYFTLILLIIIFQVSCYNQEKQIQRTNRIQQPKKNNMRLFLCGDVMTGRGIDQILPHSVNPQLYESYVRDAREYVRLAEQENGPVKQPVSYAYIWGDAMEIWDAYQPDFKIINLETSITVHDEPWPDKGVNYRMHPKNVEALSVCGIDYCALANNHIMDWGIAGLHETTESLKNAKIAFSGAGKNLGLARDPAVLKMPGARLLIFSYGSETSGVPHSWTAATESAGVNMLPGMSRKAITEITAHIQSIRQPGDLVVFSVHWGGNWGYAIPDLRREFAHRLIESGEVDIIHGHSSHHPVGIEVYRNKLILYSAGDFINDYEGISGYQQYRAALTLMYFPVIDPETGKLQSMRLVPMRIRNLQLNNADPKEAEWLLNMLNREGKMLGTKFSVTEAGDFLMQW